MASAHPGISNKSLSSMTLEGRVLMSPLAKKYTFMVRSCPLKHKDKIGDIHPLPPITVQHNLEESFVNDSIRTDTMQNSRFCRPKRTSIIRPYNALQDKHAVAYFRSPTVKDTLERTLTNKELWETPPSRNMNKLSTRGRSLRTPTPATLVRMEENFVVDSIKTSHAVTKYKPLIPPYNALRDNHSQHYFHFKGVKNLLKTTVGGQ
ncbi:PREDICTED: uncharacterized protein LOC109487895 [Branchiostoma belcheri]|uniref:Uncharacterized protein LOC109487895 n=1 Tax=Branchiostoma belcheri TaxID=7741 RepID=A0A6P5AN17_BRABE|nr:PREDICTED: uncharacterized protein LOC109487895 [Branchiostoma belcheri]